MTIKKLSKSLRQAVDWLVKNDEGCSTIKLDNRLAVCVGWQEGYSETDGTVIHSASEPKFAIAAGIKVWTSDDMRTDFDWINSPYYENGEVLSDDCSISPNENYDSLAKFFLEDYAELSKREIESDGLIVE